MAYEDRIRIETPEGVDLDLLLAGIGSRGGAAFVDALIRGAVYLVLTFGVGFGAASIDAPWLFPAVLLPAILLIEVGYDIVFETFGSGRTIGKSAFGLRVVRLGGEGIDFRASAVRNLIRPVDGLLTLYVAGVLSVLLTRRSQRLGDLVAGTIVVRERVVELGRDDALYEFGPPERSGSWDVSAVTADEVATLRRFLERRRQLEPAARARLATDLSERLRPKVVGAPDVIHPEALIEEIVRTKSARG